MKILHINTAADTGGAGKTVLRLHHQLLKMGHTSHILSRVRKQEGSTISTLDEAIKPKLTVIEKSLCALGLRAEAWFGWQVLHLASHHIPDLQVYQQADIILLNNLHGNYFDLNRLPRWSMQKPLFWILHDMWSMTGHCAYAYECERWRDSCGRCPLLQPAKRTIVSPPPTRIDLTHINFLNKINVIRKAKPQIIVPSTWLQELAQESPIVRDCQVHHVPYGLDMEIFRPSSMTTARQKLDIPIDAQVLLFGADRVANPRKGFSYLVEALQSIQFPNRIFLLTFGTPGSLPASLSHFPQRSLGNISEEIQLVQSYNASDLIIFPSLADNLPLVLLEALACGTPAVAFNCGGIPDVTRHLETGYLAKYADSSDLASGIISLLSQPELLSDMRKKCRTLAQTKYNINDNTDRLIRIFESRLASRLGEVYDQF